MRKITLSLAAAALLFTTACNSNSGDEAKTGAAQEASAQTGKVYAADAATTVIGWRATHKGGVAPRFGTLKITNGSISAENGKITGGSFVVDMNTLWADTASVTEADKKAADLEAHLKNADFFDVPKYPTAKFVITGVKPFDAATDNSLLEGATDIVSGNLTLKDSTVNVTFPAKVSVTDGAATVQAKFVVDRTSWGLNLGAEGDPANWMISKDIELTLDVKATAK